MFKDSSLVTTEDEIKTMGSFLNKDKLKGNLIYKATRDGFSYNNYIGKVLNKPNQISIIKSEHNKVFGCFFSIPRTQSNKNESDEKAFMFSLTNKEKYE